MRLPAPRLGRSSRATENGCKLARARIVDPRNPAKRLTGAASAGEDGAVLNLVRTGNVMKKTLAILLLSLVVGCSKAKELGSNQESQKETPSKHAEESSKNANPVKKLTIDDVVGSYEKDSKGRFVFLDNGALEMYMLRDLKLVDFHASRIKRIEKQLVDSIKKYGKDNSATKLIAKMLAAEKAKLAAEEEKLAAPEFPKNFKKLLEGKWEIKHGEVHCQTFGVISVYKMEPNGDLTGIQVVLKNGSRMDIPKEKQETLQKIK